MKTYKLSDLLVEDQKLQDRIIFQIFMKRYIESPAFKEKLREQIEAAKRQARIEKIINSYRPLHWKE